MTRLLSTGSSTTIGGLVVCCTISAGVAVASNVAPPAGWGNSGYTQGEEVTVAATLEDQADAVGSSTSGQSDYAYWRADPALCVLADLPGFVTELADACSEGTQLAYAGIECEEGNAIGALFRAQRDAATGELGDIEMVGDELCVTPADLAAEAARAFATLPIQPSPLHVQPPDGWTLVNVETVTYSDDQAQTFDTQLLGVPVTIRATPETFTWDYGDGSAPLTTDHPGAPWPEHTVAHTYVATGDATITLTTTWTGQFRITGSPTWTDVPGEATTSTPAGPLTVHQARTRLVEDPVG